MRHRLLLLAIFALAASCSYPGADGRAVPFPPEPAAGEWRVETPLTGDRIPEGAVAAGIAGGDGQPWLLVGTWAQGPVAHRRPVVWTSTDGGPFEGGPLPWPGPPAELGGAARAGARSVAVGRTIPLPGRWCRPGRWPRRCAP